MPELPEVEYTARQLRSAIVGATIHEALVFWERIIDLSEELILTIHRRMTGNLLLLPPGWEIDTSLKTTDPLAWNVKGPLIQRFTTENTDDTDSTINETSSDLLYCRVCFNLADGRRLLFTDPRKFGRIELWPSEREQEALKSLGT